jgi:aminopeptidase N
VTVRDWFQLCLKEGLTVFRHEPSTKMRCSLCSHVTFSFRDQQFSTSLTSSLDNRLQQVRTLQSLQFAEDAGPLSHAVRPESYVEINNFYTSTVYEKGAELCRMMHLIIGSAAFRAGMDSYFETYDGQAVTMEDWVECMLQAASSHRISFVPSMQQWMRW